MEQELNQFFNMGFKITKHTTLYSKIVKVDFSMITITATSVCISNYTFLTMIVKLDRNKTIGI